MFELQRESDAVRVRIKSQRSTKDVCCNESHLILVTEHNRATLHNQDMISLLRDLRHQVSIGGQDRIDDLLAGVSHTHEGSEQLVN